MTLKIVLFDNTWESISSLHIKYHNSQRKLTTNVTTIKHFSEVASYQITSPTDDRGHQEDLKLKCHLRKKEDTENVETPLTDEIASSLPSP